jgi:hypothetical protein
MKDLVMAGELQYIGKSMQDIALDIMNQFDDQTQQKHNEFIREILLVVMYLLKREENLTLFIDKLKSEIGERSISQRSLIDILMRNSNPSLHRRLLFPRLKGGSYKIKVCLFVCLFVCLSPGQKNIAGKDTNCEMSIWYLG